MIELVAGTADNAAAARIRTTVWRWVVVEPEALAHSRSTMAGYGDWLALRDGDAVGAASCSLNLGMEEDTAAFAVWCVLPDARRKGVGTALYRQVSEHARLIGKSELFTWGYDDDAGGVAFAELHGFVEVTRKPALRLVLDGCPRPAVDLPEGVAITTLADHPELARGVWETASETMPDIPYDTVPMSAGSFETFAARSFAGPRYIPEATFVAVHDGEVIGYAQLSWMSKAAGIGDHAMLGVRRAWRGRGIAKALKAAQIAWALDIGLTELRTGNDATNPSARAVNAHFAYTPLPDQVGYRGPLFD
jgi:GNAT superfamily N-acetyltransferase